MSIMKKIFSFGNTRKMRKPHSTTKRFQPQLEPLEDRHLLSVSSLLTSAVPGTLGQNDSHTEMELRIDTETGNSSVVGIRIDATTPGFDPSAISIFNENGTQITGSAVKYSNANYGGTSSSLLMVQLEPGNYTLRVSGDKSTYGSFVCDVFLPGDLNHDAKVSDGEYQVANAFLLSSMGVLNGFTISALENLGYSKADIKAWGEFDIDKDGKVIAFELESVAINSNAGIVTASMISDSEGPEITARLFEDNGVSATDKITSNPVIAGTVTDDSQIASFRASFNGTDWVDVTINTDSTYTISDTVLQTMTDAPVASDGSVVDGQYVLTLKATDQYGNASTETFDYTVIANNTAPTANDGAFATGEKEKLEDTLAGLVSDVDAGDIATINAATVTSTQGIAVTIKADGTFTYDPGDHFAYLNVGDTMVDEFSYTVTDAMGATTTGTVKITINPVNDAPVAKDLTNETTDQDTDKVIDVIAEATDIDNDLTDLIIASVTEPKTTAGDVMGEVKIENGKLVFYPGDDFKHLTGAAGQQETVTFSYTISDGDKTSTATVTITVAGKYDAPIVVDDTFAVNADDAETEVPVAGNITVIDQGTTADVTGVTQPAFGTVTLRDGTIYFDPGSDFNSLKDGETQDVTFTYTVANSLDPTKTATATITVTVTGVNSPPATGQSSDKTLAEVFEDSGDTDIPLSDLLQYIRDANNDPLTITTITSSKTGVTVRIVGDQIVYNPGTAFQYLSEGEIAYDTLTYTVSDGKATASGTFMIKVTGVNNLLSVADQTLTVTSSGTADPLYTGAIAVTDLDRNDNYVFELVGTPTGGPGGTLPTITIDPNTGIISVGRTNLPGKTEDGQEYVITVKVTNPNDATDTDTATIKIKVVENQPPTAVDVNYTIVEDAASTQFGDNITGVTDPEGDAFEFLPNPTFVSFEIDGITQTVPTGYTITIAEDPSNPGEAIVTFNPNGAFAVIPEGKTGVVVFEYQVRDTANGGVGTGKITINITGVDSAPIRNTTPLESTTDQNTAKTVDMNDFFTDPDDADVIAIGTPTVTGGGSVSINANGQIVFNPGTDFDNLPLYDAGNPATYKDVVITFAVKGSTNTYTLSMRVTGLNDAPTANDNLNAAETNRNTATSPIDVLANDTDIDGDALTIGWIGRGTQQGDNIDLTTEAGRRFDFTEGDYVIVSADGKTVTYYPGTRYKNLGTSDPAATADFLYKAIDGKGGTSNEATVSVKVNGADDPPTQGNKDFAANYIGERGDVSDWFDLSEYFDGQSLTYQIEHDDNLMFEIEHDVANNRFRIIYKDSYRSDQSRDFVTVKITATNVGGTFSQSFGVRTEPKTTAEIEVFAVSVSDSAAGMPTTKPTNRDTFEVAVGESYYIEIWATDNSNLDELFGPGYSTGLRAATVALSFNGTTVEFAASDVELAMQYQFGAALTPVLGSDGNSIEKIGGATTASGIGVNGNSFRIARILVTATEAGEPNFKILPDSEDDSTRLFLGRLTDNATADGTTIDDEQISLWTQQIVHTTTPLLGEETPEVVATGTLYPRVVTEPTATAANGSVAGIPDNADWIHEWQDHWVEMWVKASEAAYFTKAGCDLNYNNEYFTATEVEINPAFAGASNAVIDDASGKVTGIGGNATQLVETDGYILVGRVKFESIGSDNVLFSEASFAHDLGITLENVLVKSSTNEAFSHVGKMPQTELWAVPYDANDDGRVDVVDFMEFIVAFDQSEKNLSPFMLSTFDFDKDGKVGVLDFMSFVPNFGDEYARGSGETVYFPESFTQRYVGKTLDADSTESVNKIIDAANKAWQTALGLDRAVDIQIVVQDLSGIGDGNELANARITAVDQNGLPLSGIIVLDDDAAGMGWYSQIAEPVANGRYDLYTTLLHEMGHVYGFNTSYDAFNEVVGQYVGQLDGSLLHAADSGDLMYATLATGVRKFISEFDAAIINSAYDAARNDASLGFNDSVASSYAALTAETGSNAAAFVEQENGDFVTTLTAPAVAFAPMTANVVDVDTAARLHAMGLAVGMPLNMQQKEENGVSFTFEQVYADDSSLLDLSDDDLATLYQPQDVDESELALIDLSLDLDV